MVVLLCEHHQLGVAERRAELLTLEEDLSQVAVDRSVASGSRASLCGPSDEVGLADLNGELGKSSREDSVGESLAPGSRRPSERDELEDLSWTGEVS